MLKFLQLNLNRCHATHDLLTQSAREEKIDVILGQEPNKRRTGNSYCDIDKDCLIQCRNGQLIKEHSQGNGWVCVELPKVVAYSCYFSPNKTLEEFENYLHRLGANIKLHGKKQILLGGDLNAKATIFGSPVVNDKGRILEEWIESLELVVLNQGNIPTFSNANGSSLIDITIATAEIGKHIKNWHVEEDTENLSPHRTIRFDLATTGANDKSLNPATPRGWKISTEGWKKLTERCTTNTFSPINDIRTPQELTHAITKLCDECFTRKRSSKHAHPPVYWWTPEIAEKRRTCIRLRRTEVRLNRTASMDRRIAAKERYKEAKRDLKAEIEKEKKKAWRELCEELENDIWGKGYQIVTGKFCQKPRTRLGKEETIAQVDRLFPKHPINRWQEILITENEVQPFETAELQLAAARMKAKKAPGPNSIPPEVLKEVATKNPDVVLSVMNRCLNEGEFPKPWKTSRLILIEKPKKDPNEVTAYRPICLLDAEAKLLEMLIKIRLVKELDEKDAIHENQFGFRSGRSTMDILNKVVEIPKRIKEKAYKNREHCVLITFDIENAFNSAPWDKIIKALQRAGVSRYLIRIIQSYLKDRYIIIEDGTEIQTTCGVPQGSVLGPTLWNLFYDKILRIQIHKQITLVAYADDLAAIVTAKTKGALEDLAQLAANKIAEAMEDLGIKLAAKKTEMLIMAGSRKVSNMDITIGDMTIGNKAAVKYMGIHLDRDLRMTTHIKKVCERANQKLTTLARVMPNMGGPRQRKRRILTSAISSVILYSASIWKDALKYKHYNNMLEQINRKMAIRITAAYRTVPTTAVLAIAGLPPIKLQVEERAMVEKQGRMYKTEARANLMSEWHSTWSNYEGWARTFIKDIRLWHTRKWGEVDYHMTQAFTGHGVFGVYLMRIGKQDQNICWFCGQEDTVEHTVFQCRRWTQQRNIANEEVGFELNKDNIADTLLHSERCWNSIAKMLRSIMRGKEEEEIRREAL